MSGIVLSDYELKNIRNQIYHVIWNKAFDHSLPVDHYDYQIFQHQVLSFY